MAITRNVFIGIPLSEVGNKLKTLNKSLEQHGMVLKAETGVHVNYSSDGEKAESFELEVFLINGEEKKEDKDL